VPSGSTTAGGLARADGVGDQRRAIRMLYRLSEAVRTAGLSYRGCTCRPRMRANSIAAGFASAGVSRMLMIRLLIRSQTSASGRPSFGDHRLVLGFPLLNEVQDGHVHLLCEGMTRRKAVPLDDEVAGGVVASWVVLARMGPEVCHRFRQRRSRAGVDDGTAGVRRRGEPAFRGRSSPRIVMTIAATTATTTTAPAVAEATAWRLDHRRRRGTATAEFLWFPCRTMLVLPAPRSDLQRGGSSR